MTEKFSEDYPQEKYPELMLKLGRAYTCLFVQTEYGYTVCVPFRSSIQHKNAYIFKHSKRSQHTRSGLDYSKMVLVADTTYICDEIAVVDQDEYNETIKNIDKIISEVLRYIDDYVAYQKGLAQMAQREYQRKYRYSTLMYFHDLLNL